MPAALERKLEETKRILEILATEASGGTPILVEGRKDLKSLERLGVTGDITAVKTSGRSLLDVVREIESRKKSKVILLLDFDRRGKELTSCLAKSLEATGIKPNLVLWRELFSLVGKDVKDIEGLASYLKTANRKIGKNILNISD
jgi:5S rRNA maturation endonuclease (ribonuclease M5)